MKNIKHVMVDIRRCLPSVDMTATCCKKVECANGEAVRTFHHPLPPHNDGIVMLTEGKHLLKLLQVNNFTS